MCRVFFFWWVSKISLFANLAKQARPKKHNKIWGFSKACFEKQICVTKQPFLDQKTQIQKFQLPFYLPIFFSFNNKNQKLAETPNFYSVPANLKKRFCKSQTKTEKIEKPNFCTLVLKKAMLRKFQKIGHQKNAK